VIELSCDGSVQKIFKEIGGNFWLARQKAYLLIKDNTVNLLLAFRTSYRSEFGCSSMIYVENKHRIRMGIELE
jgi:hypothetical protein